MQGATEVVPFLGLHMYGESSHQDRVRGKPSYLCLSLCLCDSVVKNDLQKPMTEAVVDPTLAHTTRKDGAPTVRCAQRGCLLMTAVVFLVVDLV